MLVQEWTCDENVRGGGADQGEKRQTGGSDSGKQLVASSRNAERQRRHWLGGGGGRELKREAGTKKELLCKL